MHTLTAGSKPLPNPDAPEVIEAVKTPHASGILNKTSRQKKKKKKLKTNINCKTSKYIELFFHLLFGPQLIKHLLDLQSPVLL